MQLKFSKHMHCKNRVQSGNPGCMIYFGTIEANGVQPVSLLFPLVFLIRKRVGNNKKKLAFWLFITISL